jgi:hypothetical protein
MGKAKVVRGSSPRGVSQRVVLAGGTNRHYEYPWFIKFERYLIFYPRFAIMEV